MRTSSARTQVALHPARPGIPELVIIIYGYSAREVRMVPDGGMLVRRAVRTCGLDYDDFVVSYTRAAIRMGKEESSGRDTFALRVACPHCGLIGHRAALHR